MICSIPNPKAEYQLRTHRDNKFKLRYISKITTSETTSESGCSSYVVDDYVTIYRGNYLSLTYATSRPNSSELVDRVQGALLVRLSETLYLYIGHEVYEMTMTDPMVHFLAIRTGDEILAFVIGTQKTYLLNQHMVVDNTQLVRYMLNDQYTTPLGPYSPLLNGEINGVEMSFKVIHEGGLPIRTIQSNRKIFDRVVKHDDAKPHHDDENNHIVQLIINGDVDQLRQLHAGDVTIAWYHYYCEALGKTQGQCITNIAVIQFLHEIGALCAHQILLDASVCGGLEAFKYAESLGEDITYYKVFMLCMRPENEPTNPCFEYVLTRLRQKGSLEESKIHQLLQHKAITEEVMNRLLKVSHHP
jgi:hypothetical protein